MIGNIYDIIRYLKENQTDYYLVKFEMLTDNEFVAVISIQNNIREILNRYKDYKEFTIKDVLELENKEIETNIFLNKDTPPFQKYFYFKNITRIEKIEKDINRFIFECMNENFQYISDYFLKATKFQNK